MRDGAFIPYGAYWSTPFARWQGGLSHLHSVEFAAHVARKALKKRDIEPTAIDYGLLGLSVPQKGSFYGLPWLSGLLGAPHLAGPTISQACATGARLLKAAAGEVLEGDATVALAIAADRTSNGPHIYYPAPNATGGTGTHENWVLDNFSHDPFAGIAMLRTAENVAARHSISTAEQHEIVLRRYEQYNAALKDDAAFQRRYMDLPFETPDATFRKTVSVLNGDEGVAQTNAAKLASLKPVLPGGTVTYGGQTHPADGNAGMIVTTRERASALSRRPEIVVRIKGFGQARVEPAYMPEAVVPAARRAMERAGIGVGDLAAVKTHNPFVVNDICLARAIDFDVMRMNNYGSSLVWGHPQAPTGLRSVIEMIEELVVRGGGFGLFTGCAAGDVGMALVVEVGDR